ncbi:aspartate aminotransferase family protein [Mesonia aquimarina]|uniref:aspartate aminotransferase family protein n=1 Tax=Mesonia aquimarina TaxID=1504967 RepID=UPI000EF5C5FA|nr:aminotransferase class III-fold pyridoxal phosphate-dependent enzyme [Mesonia aquimarina]
MKLFDVYTTFSVQLAQAKGCYLYDDEGKQYLDFYGGHAVISIGHNHPVYCHALQDQLGKLAYYSNAIDKPIQEKLAKSLGEASHCQDYRLFMCNSGAEANENALKLASFATGKSRIVYFENAFHGRTSAAVSVSDQENLKSPLNKHNPVTKLSFGQVDELEAILTKNDVAAVIIEIIQGVGGLHEASTHYYKKIQQLCKDHKVIFIVDEVQSGWGRTGKFFAFQHHGLQPNLISMAKGMGNGFPVGGVLIDQSFSASHGMLGTTFGGNQLACAASLAVLETLQNEQLLINVAEMSSLFCKKALAIPAIKAIKGRGLMLGLVFDFDVKLLRECLVYDYQVFTGAATPKNMLRILPPLTVTKKQIQEFFTALEAALLQLNLT